MSAAELPDFLPLFLEYLCHADRLGESLRDCSPSRLTFSRRWPSACVSAKRHTKPCSARSPHCLRSKPKGRRFCSSGIARSGTRLDLKALDAAWEDEPMKFGPGAGDSCKDTLIGPTSAGGCVRRPICHRYPSYSAATIRKHHARPDHIRRIRLVSLPLPDRVSARQPGSASTASSTRGGAARASCCAGGSWRGARTCSMSAF